jgi:hypothetical protein
MLTTLRYFTALACVVLLIAPVFNVDHTNRTDR